MSFSRTLAVSLALSSFCGYVSAQESDVESAAPSSPRASLVDRSPFVRPERGRGPVATGGPLELRGFFGEGANLQVSLTRPDTHESVWAKVGDKSAKWPVEAADADDGTAEVKFDGMRLHLKLARTGDTAAAPSEAPVMVQTAEVKQETKPARNGQMSDAGRTAMFDAMRKMRDSARKEHPEWYERGKTLTPDQQAAKAAYDKANWAKVRAEVAKVSPEDAAAMPGEPVRGGRGDRGGRSRGRDGESGAGLQVGNSAPAPSDAPSR